MNFDRDTPKSDITLFVLCQASDLSCLVQASHLYDTHYTCLIPSDTLHLSHTIRSKISQFLKTVHINMDVCKFMDYQVFKFKD